MAKAKVLEDKVVISSEILTDENLEKVSILNPSVLVLRDEESDCLYEVASCDVNTLTKHGASFKNGKTHATLSVEAETEEKRKALITAEMTRIIILINKIEEQVKDYLDNTEDINVDIDFIED